MNSDRLQQIEALHRLTRERKPEERQAFLDGASGADGDLRKRVEALLQQDSVNPTPAGQAQGAGSQTQTIRAQSPHATPGAGTQLGPYQIEALIGAGGMGKVFRAIDTRLGRKVAIKISTWQFDGRFEREARAISSLNHAHICTLYDVGLNYLVMELVEGETLAARLKKGKLSIPDTLRYGTQIADALTAAHDNGITHRDLKPGNIMLARSGVKVLDFGLAKSARDAAVTAANAVIGTPAYMAPEQLDGQECDARTDIYALGLVLYEMLTGKRFTAGQTPDVAGVPPRLAHVLERCLAADQGDRWQSARDLGLELEWASQPEPGAGSARGLPSWRIAGAAGLLGAMAGAGALWVMHTSSPAPSVQATMRFRMPVPADIRLASGETFSLSPNGRTLVYMASKSDDGVRLWEQSLDSLEPKVLSGTEIAGGNAPAFWSPDSKFLAFDAGGKLKKTDLIGSPPQTICGVSGLVLGGAWNRAGLIIFGRDSGGISRVGEGGGEAVPVTKVDSSRGERNHVFPVFLPDGRHFLYLRNSTVPENSGIYVGSVDTAAGEQGLKQLLHTPFAVRFVPSPRGNGTILFFRDDGTLWAQDLDLSRMELAGDPVRVAENLGRNRVFGFFAVSENGNLIYRNGSGETSQMTWFDRHGTAGRVEGIPVNPHAALTFSPDETHIAIAKFDSGGVDVWSRDLIRESDQRLTSDPGIDSAPVWSRDGKRLAFCSARAGYFDLYQIAVGGEGHEGLLYRSGADKCPTSWSRDGKYLLFNTATPTTSGDVWVLPLEGGGQRKPVPLLNTRFNESSGVFSPDGNVIAYVSDDSGAAEVYVQKFEPASGSGDWLNGPKVPISRGGGTMPHWRADGKELFYRAGDGRLSSVVWNVGTFRAGLPESLFPVSSNWDVSHDGTRFLVAVPLDHAASGPFTVVTAWQTGLKK